MARHGDKHRRQTALRCPGGRPDDMFAERDLIKRTPQCGERLEGFTHCAEVMLLYALSCLLALSLVFPADSCSPRSPGANEFIDQRQPVSVDPERGVKLEDSTHSGTSRLRTD